MPNRATSRAGKFRQNTHLFGQRKQQTLDGVEGNLRSLKQKTGEFTIVLYGRTTHDFGRARLSPKRLENLRRAGYVFGGEQVLSPDRTSSKRKLDLRQPDKKIHDQSRLEEIVRRFKEFSVAKGYNFECALRVFARRLSNFAAVARPMQQSIATLYANSADTVTAWISYCDKINYGDFIETLKTALNAQINYVMASY